MVEPNRLHNEVLCRLAFLVFAAHFAELLNRSPLSYVGLAICALGLWLGSTRLVYTAGGLFVAGAAAVALLPWNVPNHLVVASLGALILATSDERWSLRARQTSVLLATVFVLATLQKLASPAWMDGSYVAMMTSTGGWAHGAMEWLGGYAPGTNTRVWNWAVAGRLIPMQRFPSDSAISWAIVWGTLIVEAVVAIALATSPRWPRLAGTIVATFVVATAMIRGEWLFLSLVSMLGAWAFVGITRLRVLFVGLSVALLCLWATVFF